MKQKEMLEVVLSELKIFYNASPGERSIKKFKELFKRLSVLEFDKEDIINYIDFCYKRMKKMVKEPEKRAGVDYFVAIVTSEKTLKQYLDLLRIKGEALGDNPIETRDSDDKIIRMNGLAYHKILSNEDRDIFLCASTIKFLIKDYSEMVPRLYTLSQYNNKYPEKKITWETIEDVVQEGEICDALYYRRAKT